MHACLVAQSCLTLSNPLGFPGKNSGVGCHFLLQGIFLAQGLNLDLLCLLRCRWVPLPDEPLGKLQASLDFPGGTSSIFFGEMLAQVSDLFFSWLVYFLRVLRVLCIFQITLFYQIFYQIFSQFVLLYSFDIFIHRAEHFFFFKL